MFFGHKNKSGESYGVILNIASGTVGVAIVRSIQSEKMPEILYVHRESLRIGEEKDVEERIRIMRRALFSTVLKLSEKGLKEFYQQNEHAFVNRILVLCGSPWSHTITRSVHLKKDEPIKITPKLVKDLVEKAAESIENTPAHSEKLAGLGMRIVERSIIDIHVNGYHIDDPYGVEAEELAIAHTIGLIPEDVDSAVAELQENILTETSQSAHTYALVLYCVLRDLYPHTESALIMDVSGESTEVSVVNDHTLQETQSTDYGVFGITRDIAKTLRTIPEEAWTHMRDYGEGTLEKTLSTKVEEALQSYRNAVTDLLTSLSLKYVLPSYIFLSTDPALTSFFNKILTTVRHEHNKHDVRVISVGEDVAKDLSNFTEGSVDTFLAVGARFFHKLHGCGEIIEE